MELWQRKLPQHACTSCLSSSFLPCAPLSLGMPAQQRMLQQRSFSTIQTLELDQDIIVAILVGLAGIAVGIGIPIFYKTQMKGVAMRNNDQPCFLRAGSGAQTEKVAVLVAMAKDLISKDEPFFEAAQLCNIKKH
ncbi:hypothetical protein L7F22_049971 [Adiantum nelumboides]|nr:hypothetical protein [Adiantum nelumboides]